MNTPEDPPLILAAMYAPLIAIRKRWPKVLHAATMEAVVAGWDGTSVESACGLRGLKLVMWSGTLVQWPPRVKGLPEGMTRCRACHMATGRKRPISEVRQKASA